MKVQAYPLTDDIGLQVGIKAKMSNRKLQTSPRLLRASDALDKGTMTQEIDQSKFSKILTKVLTEQNLDDAHNYPTITTTGHISTQQQNESLSPSGINQQSTEILRNRSKRSLAHVKIIPQPKQTEKNNI